MANTVVTFTFQISYATPITSLINDLKVNLNYLSYLDEMFYTKPLKDGECDGDNYFSNFLCHAYN